MKDEPYIRRLAISDEAIRAYAAYCDAVDNTADKFILRALGVAIGPRAIEHTDNITKENG